MEKKINLHTEHRQRLKNRALREGLDNFEPHNVLELMLFYVLPQVDTNEIAHELINRFGSFDAVFQAPIEELVKIKGIQRHAATFIKLMPSFLRYYAKGHDAPDSAHLSVEEIKEELKKRFVGINKEAVVCMFFDNNGALIDSAKTFNGSIDDVSFTYRDLVNEALSVNAFKVAIAHNHPSNNPLPSPDDIQSTKHLNSSLKQVSIDLIDSYIVTNNSCVGVMEFTLDKVKKSF